LGRGGSDITAVAIAAALEADKCEIMTDVDGIFTSNPRLVIDAQKITELSLDEMLDLAELGSQVLKSSAVEFAKRHNIKIFVGSSFTGKIGTIVTNEALDKKRIVGIAIDNDIILVNIENLSKSDSLFFFQKMADAKIGIKFIWQQENKNRFIIESDDLPQVKAILDKRKNKIKTSFNEEIGLVSVIGVGIGFKTETTARLFQILNTMRIIPEVYSFSETRITFGFLKKNIQEVANTFHHYLISEEKYAKV
jgi:aspartate kinase